MKEKIWYRYIPFVIVCMIQWYTWYHLLFRSYPVQLRHWMVIPLVVVNGILYWKRFRVALAMTGGILLVSALNLVELFPLKATIAFFIKVSDFKLSLFPIQWRSAFVLLLYCILNGGYWIEVYADYKHGKQSLEVNGE